MPTIRAVEIRRIVGMATHVAPDELGASHAKLLKNYDPAPVGNLARRSGSENGDLTDHHGDAMDLTWWDTQWGDEDVSNIIVVPKWPLAPNKLPVGVPKQPGGNMIIAGPGTVAKVDKVEKAIWKLEVTIPSSLPDANAFNVTITAKKQVAGVWATDTAYSGPITLDGIKQTGVLDIVFSQVTPAAAVTWTNGVALVSAKFTAANPAQLTKIGGMRVKVRAWKNTAKNGTPTADSDYGLLTAEKYLLMAVSASTIQVGTAFTLTVTAKKADGTTDTAYSSQVNVTEDSTVLSLVKAAGGAFSGFAGADFTAGVASASIKFSGDITSTESVRISAVQNGATSPSGVIGVSVTRLVTSTDPGAANVRTGTGYIIENVNFTGTMESGPEFTDCSAFIVSNDGDTLWGGGAVVAFRYPSYGTNAAYYKFTKPLTAIRAIQAAKENLWLVGTGPFYFDLDIWGITEDFTPVAGQPIPSLSMVSLLVNTTIFALDAGAAASGSTVAACVGPFVSSRTAGPFYGIKIKFSSNDPGAVRAYMTFPIISNVFGD